MLKPISIFAVFALSLSLMGCSRTQTTTTTTDVPPPNPMNAPPVANNTTDSPTRSAPIPPTPLKDAVSKALVAGDGRVFPKGTRLVGVDLNDGTVTLDFSKEFQKLGDMGDSVESEAQKTLREAVATVPAVEKMRVTVEGKPYESQMTDWNTPFSVRDTSKDISIPNGAASR